MQNDNKSHCKYVFVCGMPRSGTSVLGRNVARLENCTGFKNTGVLEDEGIYLQDVYPMEFELGGPTRFGFDPRAHRTEASELLAPPTVERLYASWHAYWDNSKEIFVEKTPGNLLMTRFLQAAFPNAYFVVVKRHPVPVCLAAQKWKVSVSSLDTAFKHWLHCYKIFDEDKEHLKHVYELTYEDYVQNADRYHREIAAFIGTRVPEPPKEDTFRYVAVWRDPKGRRVPEASMEAVSISHNKKYLERWSELLQNALLKFYYRHLARKYETQFARHGYSLIKETGLSERAMQESIFSRTLGVLCCLGANGIAFAWRALTQSRWWFRRQVRAVIPESLRARMRRVKDTAFLKVDHI